MDIINEISDKIINYTHTYLGDNALAVVLAGSAGKGKFVEGWSDLDYLIVIKYIDRNAIAQIQQKIAIEPIHIGLTILTYGEIQQSIISAKDIITLFEIGRGHNQIIYMAKDYHWRKITKSMVWNCTNAELGKCIKSIKTKTYTNYRECFKQLVLFKKLILRLNHIIAYDFDEIDNIMNAKLHDNYLPLVPLFLQRNTLDVSTLNQQIVEYVNIWEAKWSK